MRLRATPRAVALAALGVLLVLTLQAYWATLGYAFVWDDYPLIVKSQILHGPDAVHKIFFRNFWDVGGRDDAFRHFYRPLVTFSYWLDAHWSGWQPAGFHATNVALHLACVAMAFALALDLLGDAGLAFLAGAYFALHPTHVENVAWISGRTDGMAAFFVLAALLAWRRADRGGGRGWLAGGALAYFAALLCKEVAVLAPAAWLLFPAAGGAEAGAWTWTRTRRAGLLWAGAALGAYALLRLNVLGVLVTNRQYPGLGVYLPALGWVLYSYLRLAFSGLSTNAHYSDVQFSFMHGTTAALGLLLLVAVVVLAWRLLRGRGTAARGAWLALLFLLPVFSLGSFGDVLYADRFLYLPSLGFGILLAAGVGRLAARLDAPRRLPAVFAGAGLLALALLWQTARAATVWSDNVRLFERASESSGDSVMIWNNLCLAYSYDGRYFEAEQAARRALQVKPDYGYAWHNLGVALRRQVRLADALPCLEKAVALEPKDSLFAYNLAETLAASGHDAEAVRWYRRTLALKPSNVEARHNLGFLLLKAGRLKEARPLLEAAAEWSENPAPALNSLGILEAEEGNTAHARALFLRAIAIDPGLTEARRNLERLSGKGKP